MGNKHTTQHQTIILVYCTFRRLSSEIVDNFPHNYAIYPQLERRF